jgi:His-Xaa-Ser system radical SAM maturase HxsC
MCTCLPNSPDFYADPERIEAALCQLPPNLPKLTLSGGEPTLRKDILSIIRMTRRDLPRTELCVLTNGRMFYYADFAKKFVESGVDSIAIPLHGHNSKLHDRITRTPGSFKQTVQGIKNLLPYSNKVRIDIRVVIHKLNYKQLPEICQFITEEFRGIYQVVLFPIDIIGTANINRKKLIVKITSVTPYLEKGIEILEKNGFKFQLFHVPFCVIDEKYWKNVAGMTVEEAKVTFEPCGDCIMRDNCSGIWKTYAFRVGTSEFKPTKPRSTQNTRMVVR